MILNGFNAGWEHGGINGLTPSEMFLQRLIKSDTHKKETGKCNPCTYGSMDMEAKGVWAKRRMFIEIPD